MEDLKWLFKKYGILFAVLLLVSRASLQGRIGYEKISKNFHYS